MTQNRFTPEHLTMLRQLAEQVGESATMLISGEIIENADGQIIGMTRNRETTGELLPIIITEEEATAAGLALHPNVRIVSTNK